MFNTYGISIEPTHCVVRLFKREPIDHFYLTPLFPPCFAKT